MARIEDAVSQDEIANSLLGDEAQQEQPEQETSDFAFSGADLLNEAIEEQESGPFNFNAERAERVQHLRTEQPEMESQEPQERLRSERAEETQEQIQEQPQAATPQQVTEVSQSLERAVEQFALNDTATASEFASEFVGAFGSTPHDANVDVQALGSTMAKAALSTVMIYEATRGDMSKLPAIPEDAARKFAFDLLASYRLDPRTMPNIDPSLLSRTVQGGMFNFLSTYYQKFGGRVSDLRQLNDPQQAEFYLSSFMKALGVEGQPDRQVAIRFADACGKYLLGVIGKLQRAQEQNASQQPRGRASRGQRVPSRFREGVKGSKVPRFQSNQDIFSGSAVEAALSQKL